MIKEQTIAFVGWLDFKVSQGGIISSNTEILNLIFSDNGQSNMMTLIGKTLEWKPKIWTDFEKHKIMKLKQLNIICLTGDLRAYYDYCCKLFPNVEINYYDYSSYDISITMKGPLRRKNLIKEYQRTNVLYCSVGTMRINRYILVKEAIAKGYNVYHPAITYNQSKDYEYQISKCTNNQEDTAIAYEQTRVFQEEMHQEEFNAKQIEILCKSYIHVVVTFPNTNWLKDKDDEKFFDTILCKTLPFMLCEKDSNISGVDLLGFKPYKGFNFKNDSNDNHILRWQLLLNDNTHVFKNLKIANEIYDMNKEIIDFNYKRLLETDWQKLKLEQYNKLPLSIKEYLKTF